MRQFQKLRTAGAFTACGSMILTACALHTDGTRTSATETQPFVKCSEQAQVERTQNKAIGLPEDAPIVKYRHGQDACDF